MQGPPRGVYLLRTMNNYLNLISALNIFVYITLFLIILEYLYSMHKKDGAYSTPEMVGNFLNAIIMKFFLNNIGIMSYFGYLVLIKKQIPSLVTFTGQSFLAYVMCIVIIDFTFYWYHRAQHRFKLLWSMHFVHHSDDKLNLSTSYRMSLIEKMYLPIVMLPAILLGFNPFLVIACWYMVSVYQFFHHSCYIKYPRILNKVLTTPSIHSVHHQKAYSGIGKNFGVVLSLWDRMFGTYEEPSGSKDPGIIGYHQDDFIRMQIDPIVSYLRDLLKAFTRG